MVIKFQDISLKLNKNIRRTYLGLKSHHNSCISKLNINKTNQSNAIITSIFDKSFNPNLTI